jgi:E3 ubiquitin-protein ligase BRE1
MRREKEVIAKVESADAVRNAIDNAESRIEELELQLQKCVIDKNDLGIKMEEALQDAGQITCLINFYGVIYWSFWFLNVLSAAGRNDIKSEFRVMASALSKEIGMMEAQLKRWKETAHEALSLREEAQSLKTQLNRKVLSHLPMLFLILSLFSG